MKQVFQTVLKLHWKTQQHGTGNKISTASCFPLHHPQIHFHHQEDIGPRIALSVRFLQSNHVFVIAVYRETKNVVPDSFFSFVLPPSQLSTFLRSRTSTKKRDFRRGPWFSLLFIMNSFFKLSSKPKKGTHSAPANVIQFYDCVLDDDDSHDFWRQRKRF